jgi:hypothetical protein
MSVYIYIYIYFFFFFDIPFYLQSVQVHSAYMNACRRVLTSALPYLVGFEPLVVLGLRLTD